MIIFVSLGAVMSATIREASLLGIMILTMLIGLEVLIARLLAF
jgi:hypothetical protein